MTRSSSFVTRPLTKCNHLKKKFSRTSKQQCDMCSQAWSVLQTLVHPCGQPYLMQAKQMWSHHRRWPTMCSNSLPFPNLRHYHEAQHTHQSDTISCLEGQKHLSCGCHGQTNFPSSFEMVSMHLVAEDFHTRVASEVIMTRTRSVSRRISLVEERAACTRDSTTWIKLAAAAHRALPPEATVRYWKQELCSVEENWFSTRDCHCFTKKIGLFYVGIYG